MGELERKRERINRIDRELYLILAVSLMWPLELQSQRRVGGHSSLGTEVVEHELRGQGVQTEILMPLPSWERPSGKLVLSLAVSLLQDARLAGRKDGRGGQEKRKGARLAQVPTVCWALCQALAPAPGKWSHLPSRTHTWVSHVFTGPSMY